MVVVIACYYVLHEHTGHLTYQNMKFMYTYV